MSEGAIADSTLAEPQTEARDVIATCRSAWGTISANQSQGAEVDENALTVYTSDRVRSSKSLGILSRNGWMDWRSC
jgi:hypothetical protein